MRDYWAQAPDTADNYRSRKFDRDDGPLIPQVSGRSICNQEDDDCIHSAD